MTKLLEKAIAKARELTEDEQDALAVALLAMVGDEFPTDDAARAAIREGLEQADRDGLVSDETVAEAHKRHGI
jgi:hypothetical protein